MTPGSDQLSRALRGPAPSAAAMEAHARAAAGQIARAASEHGLLDIAVWTMGSPIGELHLAVTPRGLLHVGFEEEDRAEVLALLARTVSPRILEAAGPTDAVRRELDEYFAGQRVRFEVGVDRRLVRGIARDVLAAARRIPFGATSTYGELAARIGRPRAARAVGNALGSNPIPIVIPCHRVLRGNGGVGGYAGGAARKERLLALEGTGPER